jgi:hypothetical protein
VLKKFNLLLYQKLLSNKQINDLKTLMGYLFVHIYIKMNSNIRRISENCGDTKQIFGHIFYYQ